MTLRGSYGDVAQTPLDGDKLSVCVPVGAIAQSRMQANSLHYAELQANSLHYAELQANSLHYTELQAE